MAYVYPKFSSYEIPGLRFGGPGLGNLLFIWARSIIFANENHFQIISPTWPSLKIGPWIRNEKDKRFYGDLFKSINSDVRGIKKQALLLFGKKTSLDDIKFASESSVILYDTFEMNFNGLVEYRDMLVSTIIDHLKNKNSFAKDFVADDAVNVHVRLGDFISNEKELNSGANNTKIPIDWYVETIEKIRKLVGNVHINVFSDGTDEEIEKLLELDNVERVNFGNSISDIIALSKSPLMISSGSSFSMWARFIGLSSCIAYPKQIKDRFLSDDEGFEVEIGFNDSFSEEVCEKIKKMYNR